MEHRRSWTLIVLSRLQIVVNWVFFQVSIAVLLDNFLAASNDMKAAERLKLIQETQAQKEVTRERVRGLYHFGAVSINAVIITTVRERDDFTGCCFGTTVEAASLHVLRVQAFGCTFLNLADFVVDGADPVGCR